ncbi:MAG: substrate-binding domain-containing protein [Pirellulales bacterium]|nr:substrate-binding domain-containing protein [Pirellulales bacterium]
MKTVMVLHPGYDHLQAQFLRGISDYAHEKKNWILQINPNVPSLEMRSLEKWHGDGIIATLHTKAEIVAARALPQPVVNLSGAIDQPRLPRVMVDQAAMGRLAAEHLLSCGLSRFAYFGENNRFYSEQRKQGFLQQLADAGRSCEILECTTIFNRRNPWYEWMESLERWLRTLRFPIGVLAVHDFAGTVFIETCIRLGLRVPEDVAVIGTGDDIITCDFSVVPLTSVARNSRAVGYQAAALLDRLMAGEPVPEDDVLLRPEGVVRRRSTDVVAVEDPQVAAAVEYIREHLTEPLSLTALERKLDVSRRTLELRFGKSLGCTPSEYIARKRVERAKTLLSACDKLKLQKIANACGFSSPRHFREVFQRISGTTPAEFRSHHRRRSHD